MSAEQSTTRLDPRRWWTLAFSLLAVTITVIDNTVLTVSIPRIMNDLDTNVTGVQWVFTGYALTFASMLVIGGRLGDIHGPRRIVIIGASLFGIGSLLAAVSTTMSMLILGEALIEGVGAALLVPNTLSLIARSFEGRERAFAFATWATALGAAAALGPVLGGFLTTYYSWRWAFGINVIIAPVMVLGMAFLVSRNIGGGDRQRLDVRGAVLIAAGTFLVVFGLSQGETYGWWVPIRSFTLAGRDVWPTSAPVSIVPFAFLAGVVLLYAFVRSELTLERQGRHPLFEFSQFRLHTFRYANIANFSMAFAQLGVSFCVALYLQESEHLSPMQNGLWVLPVGAAILCGAPFGGWLSRSLGTTNTLRVGSALSVVGLVAQAVLLSRNVPYWAVLPAFVAYGFAGGIVSSQMNQMMLHDIAPAKSGAASGISTTSRQTATALGAATLGAIFATVSARHGVHAALLPALLVGALALAGSSAVMWLMPQIDRKPESVAEELIDDFALVDPVDARMEG